MSELSLNKLNECIDHIKKGKKIKNTLLHTPNNEEEAKLWNYEFWNTQPVSIKKNNLLSIIDDQFINKMKSDEITKMCKPYVWKYLNINDDVNLNLITNFLNENYSNNEYKNYFTPQYLKWLLCDEYKILAITPIDKNIIGGICLVTINNMQIFNLTKKVANIMYMCLHKKLKEKGLMKLFVKELTRLLSNDDIEIGFFSTKKYIPTPIFKMDYYCRYLNYEKLYNIGFIVLEKKEELNNAINLYKLNNKKTIGKKLNIKYLDQVYEFISKYQDKYNIYEKYTLEKFIKTFLENDIVSSFVITNNEDQVIDFYSYYKTKLYKNNEYIDVGKVFMYTCDNTTPITIFKNMIQDAYNENLDLLMCNEIMENNEILYDNLNKFVKSSSSIYYNFFNLNLPELSPEQVCLFSFD